MTANLLLTVAIVGYVVGIMTAAVRTIYRSPEARRVASVAFSVAWAAHLGAIVHAAWYTGRFPLSNLSEYLLVLGWVVLSLHLYVWFVLKIEVAGLVLPPLAAIMSLASMQLIPTHSRAPIEATDGWFLVHTTVSTLGMAILCVAFAMSLIYLIQDRALKSKKALRLLERLPSLQRADQIGFRALIVGFILLTLGIGTGVVVNAEVYRRLLVMGPKQIFPVLAWIVFAAILVARPLLGFRGRKSAYLTIAGFMFGLLTVIGMTL